jgi:hypothetical protein
LPLHTTPQILGPDAAREVKINKRHEFEFQDAELDMAAPLRYGGIVRDMCGRDVVLKDGETYRCYVNPIRPARLYVCEADGAYIGHAERIDAAPRVNREAVLAAIADAAHRERVLLSPLRARHAGDVAEHAEMLARNDAVLAIAAKAAGGGGQEEQLAVGSLQEERGRGRGRGREEGQDDALDEALMEMAETGRPASGGGGFEEQAEGGSDE